ncbi:unnamed protein product [Closterium sp. NIES-53]
MHSRLTPVDATVDLDHSSLLHAIVAADSCTAVDLVIDATFVSHQSRRNKTGRVFRRPLRPDAQLSDRLEDRPKLLWTRLVLELEVQPQAALGLGVLVRGVLELEVLAQAVLALGVLELEVLALEVLVLGVLELEVLALEVLVLGVLVLEVLALEVLVLGVLELEVLLERKEQEREEQERQELQRLDHHQQHQQQTPQPPPLQQLFPQVSGLRALGLPSSPPVHSQSPTAYGPTFPPPNSTPAVFSPPRSWSSPPIVPHDWTSCCPPRARPSSPLADLRTVLFHSPPCRSPPVSVLPSPPGSSLTVSSHPITNYYHVACPVVSRILASLVTDPRASPSSVSALTAAVADFASIRHLDYATRVVAAPPPRPLSVGGESALGCDILEDRQFEMEFLAATSPSLCAILLSLEGDPDALDIPTPRTYIPPPRANIVDGMWLFKVKQPPGSPPVFKARYVARGFIQREGVDFFQTFAPTPKMTTLRDRLHEEIWLRRPPGFSNTFPPGTQWSLRRPVYGLRQSPREWHHSVCSTLRDLGFRPSFAHPSLFVHAGSTPFFILVYVDDLVFATADKAALTEVKSELQKRHKCTDLGELQRYLGLCGDNSINGS